MQIKTSAVRLLVISCADTGLMMCGIFDPGSVSGTGSGCSMIPDLCTCIQVMVRLWDILVQPWLTSHADTCNFLCSYH